MTCAIGSAKPGECYAADHLRRLGFEIVERNFRTRWGELDLVGFDGETLVFCEVKTRRQGARSPFESLHERKRRQVRRIAACWLALRTDRPHAADLRFDAIGVSIDVRDRLVGIDHLEGAF